MRPTYVAPKIDPETTNFFDYAPKAYISHCPWWKTHPTAPVAYGQVCYTDEALYVRLTCLESDPTVTYYQPNDMVCKDSCLEFFINPTPGKDNFSNFECNAAGTLLVGRYCEGDFELIDPATRPDFQVKAKREADFWQVEYVIPAAFLEKLFPGFCYADGTAMEVNFYKCGDETPQPHYSCWSVIRSKEISFFHSEDFGTLIRI